MLPKQFNLLLGANKKYNYFVISNIMTNFTSKLKTKYYEDKRFHIHFFSL